MKIPKRPKGSAGRPRSRPILLDGQPIHVGAIGDEGAVFRGGIFVGFVDLATAFRATQTGRLRRRDIRRPKGEK